MRSLFNLPLKSVLALALLGTLPGIVAAQEESPDVDVAPSDQAGKTENNDREQKQQSHEEQTKTLKAFDLEHAKPQEMVTLIQTISARQHQAEMNRKAKEQAKEQPDDQARGQRAVAPQQPQRTAVQFRAGAVAPHQNRLAVAVDEQSKTLFVRGTEEQVSSIEKLVETFDTESADLQKQEIDGITIVPVKHDRLQQINTILNQLQLQTQALRVGDTAVLILPDDEDQAKQAEQVIAKLKENGSDSQQNEQQNDSEN